MGDQRLVNPKTEEIRQVQTDTKISTEGVDKLVVNEVPFWVILLLVIGWLLPTPREIGLSIFNLFRKKDAQR